MFKRACAFLVTSLITLPALSANNGENWEVSTQIAQGNNPLGPATVMKLCFPTNKDMKEPPPPPDSSCKSSVQQSGKRANFKTVCNDDGVIITSSGYTEEISTNHFHTDLTMVTEADGSRSQQRQVGDVKKVGGSCDPNDMSAFMRQGAAQQASSPDIPAPVMRTSAKNASAKNQGSSTESSEQETASSPSDSKKNPSSMIEAGKSILKGLLPF